MGCVIVTTEFNNYEEKSKEARKEYMKNTENNNTHISCEFKKGLEEFCFNIWKNKITSALEKDNRYFSHNKNP